MARLTRYLVPQVRRDLRRKMVFVGGPRQVGKTTLARSLPGAKAGYLNWDVPADRERILRGELPAGRLWVFDEIHKYRGWRNYLKGLYDARPRGQRILVTGSARLDFYRFGGDSLQGRYHLLRLHPLSVAELGDLARRSSRTCSPSAASRSRSSGARRPRRAAGRGSTAAAGARGGHVARADPGPRPARDPDAAPARAGRLAALTQRAARGPPGQPPDGRPLARRARAPVRRLPPRRPSAPRACAR